MGMLITLFIVLMIAIQKTTGKKNEAPGMLFCFIWLIVSFLASLRLFGINEADILTWCVILVGLLSFCLGTNIRIKLTHRSRSNIEQQEVYISSKVFWILSIIFLVLNLKDLRQSIELMSRGYTLGLIRSASYGLFDIKGYDINRDFLSVWLDYLRDALQVILVATGIEYFVIDIRNNKKYLVIAIALVVIDAFTNGGRWGIAYFIVELYVCYKIYNSRNEELYKIKISKKTRSRILVILVALVASMLVVSSVRGLSIEDSLSYYYAYICGCVPLLDIKISVVNAENIWGIGFGALYGVLALFVPILFRFVLGTNLPTGYQEAIRNVITGQTVYDIGGGRTYNAFVTCFYYLYADLRWFGVILGMLLFGIVAGNCYRNTITRSYSSVVPYLIISQMILKSIQIYPLSSQSYFALILVIGVINLIKQAKMRLRWAK